MAAPGGGDTIIVDPSVTVPVSVFAGPGSSVTGTTVATDLPQVSLVADVPTATESSASAGEFTLTRTVASVADLAYTLTAQYTVDTASTAAAGTDYTALTGSVTFAAGSATATIQVNPLDAGKVGGSVALALDLSPSDCYVIDTDNPTATVTINDDDLPTVTVSASEASATESGTPGQFTVTLANGVTLGQDLLVSYTLTGTAVNGDDYEMLPGDVIIPAGDGSATIPITPLDVGLAESSQSVTLTLAASADYCGSSDTAHNHATVTIQDDDPLSRESMQRRQLAASGPAPPWRSRSK